MSIAVLRNKNRVTIPIKIIKQTGLKENDPLKIDLIEQQDELLAEVLEIIDLILWGDNS